MNICVCVYIIINIIEIYYINIIINMINDERGNEESEILQILYIYIYIYINIYIYICYILYISLLYHREAFIFSRK